MKQNPSTPTKKEKQNLKNKLIFKKQDLCYSPSSPLLQKKTQIDFQSYHTQMIKNNSFFCTPNRNLNQFSIQYIKQKAQKKKKMQGEITTVSKSFLNKRFYHEVYQQEQKQLKKKNIEKATSASKLFQKQLKPIIKIKKFNRQFQESIFAYKNIQPSKFSIHDFVILRSLGKGKFGQVFCVKQKKTNCLFAIKQVEKKRIKELKLQEQFIKELKIQSYLCHRNLIANYGFFYDRNYFYLIMQLGCDGQLFKKIGAGRTFNQETISYVIKNLLEGLLAMHKQNILHRDIKPENIVLIHGVVKICDFGWATHKAEHELKETICGTPLYLSPEIIRKEQYDESVDLWAIGIVAYELYYGFTPFNIISWADLNNIITEQVEFPNDQKVCSKDFQHFIRAILKKNRTKRLNCTNIMKLRFISLYDILSTCGQLCN